MLEYVGMKDHNRTNSAQALGTSAQSTCYLSGRSWKVWALKTVTFCANKFLSLKGNTYLSMLQCHEDSLKLFLRMDKIVIVHLFSAYHEVNSFVNMLSSHT